MAEEFGINSKKAGIFIMLNLRRVVKSLLGRKRASSRRPRRQSRFSGYNSRKSKQSLVTARSSLRANLTPVQKILNLREYDSTDQRLTGREDGNGVSDYKVLIRPYTRQAANADNRFFPGGFLPHFHFFDRAQVIKADVSAIVTILSADQGSNPGVDLACAITSTGTAQAVSVTSSRADFLKIGSVPNSKRGVLGSPSGGHNQFKCSFSVDIEKFVGHPLDRNMALVRDANNISPPNDLSSLTTPAFVIMLLPINLVDGDNIEVRVDITYDYTVLFTGLRSQVTRTNQMPTLTLVE